MSELKIKGIVKLINDKQTFDSGFEKREVVLTTLDQYPQDVKLDFTKDKCDLLSYVELGETIEIDFNVRGNEYNGKYYVNLQGWKITKDEPTELPTELKEEGEDDLPF